MSTLSTYDSTVNSFYLAFYGRPADTSGLKFWSQQLANNNGDLGAITQFFAASDEAQVRFGTDTVADRIAEIYQSLFNRAPEAGGLAFWTNAVEQGHASLADVSISILKGAQGSDATLSTLRQQAADAFTAQVEASGSQYAGYASIEAARILVRAVTADATADDLDALVNAAVSFADTATKTPQVVEAIAINTTLLALFDTARGVKEPVKLAQALADTAKAAAGDPVTLESLLRGGGMDKVLKVMPAKATLKDVVDALAKGGLPAAVDVVYPPAPVKPAPAFGLDLSFEKVASGDFDLDLKDNITSKKLVDVTFSYTGTDLRAGQYFEYTINGTDWIKSDIDVFAETNTVVLKNVHLMVPHAEIIGNESPSPFLAPEVALPNATTTISLRAVAPGVATTKPFVQEIVFDGYVAAPVVHLENDTAHAKMGSDHDLLTKDGSLKVTNVEPGAKVEYLVLAQQQVPVDDKIDLFGIDSVDLPASTNGAAIQIPVNAPWADEPVYSEGKNTVYVRVTDLAGNQRIETFVFTLDTIAPSKPTAKLVADKKSSLEDNVTKSGLVKISGLATDGKTGWEYSIDGGKSWKFGGENGDHSSAVLDLGADKAADGIKKLVVRQVDLAGNAGEPSELLTVTLDRTAPTNALDFVSVTGAKEPGSTKTTLEEADVVFSYDGVLETGSRVEYRIGGEWLPLDPAHYGNGKITVPVTDLKGGDPTVEVRLVDSAGNAGEAASVVIDGPAIQGTLLAHGMLGMSAITVTSSISGQLFLTSDDGDTALTINGLPGLVSKDVAVQVGVQEKEVSGILKVENTSTVLIEPTGTVIALGTKGHDDTLEGGLVMGFAGDDVLTGTDGSDYLDGGAGYDTVYGGKGGDGIIVFDHDTLVYTSGADSNLSSLLNTTPDTSGQGQNQSSDFVFVMPGGAITFDLTAMQTVSGAYNAYSSPAFAQDPLTYFANLSTAYNAQAQSSFDAVLFKSLSGSSMTLVVNNGDQVIDQHDLVITIVGAGEIHLDGGNVIFAHTPD